MNRVGTPPNYHWETVSQKDCYDEVLKDYIGNWGVVQPDGVDDPSSPDYCACYYFKDYESNHVRVIALDCFHWSTAQKNWFVDVLEDANDDTRGYKYHVVCCVHAAPFVITAQPNNPFDTIDYNNAAYVNLPDAYNAVKDFIDDNGNFICYLCGHIHDDYFGVGAAADLSNQLVIGVGTAGVFPATQYSSMARARDNISQDCFNVVGIDVTTKTLKLLRIGADYDRYMRKRHTLSWNYGTNQLIFVD